MVPKPTLQQLGHTYNYCSYQLNTCRGTIEEAAESLFVDGDTQKAVRILEFILRPNPNDYDAHLLLGYIYSQLIPHRRNEAERHLQKAIRLRRDQEYPRHLLTELYVSEGKLDAALRLAQSTLSLFPHSSDAHLDLGSVLLVKGKQVKGEREDREDDHYLDYVQEAEIELRAAYHLDPTNFLATERLGAAYMLIGEDYLAEYFLKRTLLAIGDQDFAKATWVNLTRLVRKPWDRQEEEVAVANLKADFQKRRHSLTAAQEFARQSKHALAYQQYLDATLFYGVFPRFNLEAGDNSVWLYAQTGNIEDLLIARRLYVKAKEQFMMLGDDEGAALAQDKINQIDANMPE